MEAFKKLAVALVDEPRFSTIKYSTMVLLSLILMYISLFHFFLPIHPCIVYEMVFAGLFLTSSSLVPMDMTQPMLVILVELI